MTEIEKMPKWLIPLSIGVIILLALIGILLITRKEAIAK
jgi:hypothetical protein